MTVYASGAVAPSGHAGTFNESLKTNGIDKNGTVVHTPYKDPRNMTFDHDIFTNHGKHHIPY
jgi:hypothetical protein